MAHIPSTMLYAAHKHFVLLLEDIEIETPDTNLVMNYEAGIHLFSSKERAKQFANAANTFMTETVAKAFTKETEND